MFDFRVVTQWVDATLHQYLPASLVTTTEFVLVGVCLLVAYAVMALGLIYAERKVCAFFQCRLGPNRVGPFGMIQTVTDMIKMLIKEIIEINHVDRFLFNLAPYIVIIASLLAFSCIPSVSYTHLAYLSGCQIWSDHLYFPPRHPFTSGSKFVIYFSLPP